MSNPQLSPKKHRRTGPVRLGGRPVTSTIPQRLSARCDELLHEGLALYCVENDMTRTVAIRKGVRVLVARQLLSITEARRLAEIEGKRLLAEDAKKKAARRKARR